MKLLRVKANNFKNCADGFTIDLVSKSRKTAEDKEYELQEKWKHTEFSGEVKTIPIMLNTQTVPVEKIQCEMTSAKKLVRRI